MGLRQAPQYAPLLTAWLLPAALTLVALGLQLAGDDGQLAFRYARDAILGGDAYRLLSGHLVHLGWSHFVLNIVGLLLVWYLVGGAFSPGRWLLVLAAAVAAIDLGFWYLLPGLDWYVGLSGVLHGVFAAGSIAIWAERRMESLIFCAALIAKLLYEALAGPLPGSEASAGGVVITEAHLFGACGGAAAAALFYIVGRIGASAD